MVESLTVVEGLEVGTPSGCAEDEATESAFRWSLTLISKILVRSINEGEQFFAFRDDPDDPCCLVCPPQTLTAHLCRLHCGDESCEHKPGKGRLRIQDVVNI